MGPPVKMAIKTIGDPNFALCSAQYIEILWQIPHNRTMKAKLGSRIVLIAIFSGGSLWGGIAILNAGLGMVQAQTERVATESRPGAEIVSECRKTLENVESLEVELSQQ